MTESKRKPDAVFCDEYTLRKGSVWKRSLCFTISIPIDVGISTLQSRLLCGRGAVLSHTLYRFVTL